MKHDSLWPVAFRRVEIDANTIGRPVRDQIYLAKMGGSTLDANLLAFAEPPVGNGFQEMKFVALQGPPEAEHGTIYILRPQGMVGAASRFRVGINDLTLGQSKRNRYHVIYAPPGTHEVWNAGDKKRWKTRSVQVEPGGVYYFQAMNMKPIPDKKAPGKLKQCKLAREIDLTRIQ